MKYQYFSEYLIYYANAVSGNACLNTHNNKTLDMTACPM
jgi:hypothetical protein